MGRHSHPQLIHYYEYTAAVEARVQREGSGGVGGRGGATERALCCAAREAIARPARLPGPDRGAARAATPLILLE